MTILYYGVDRSIGNDPNKVTYSSGSSTSKELEVAIDNSKSLTRQDVLLLMEVLEQYFEDSSRATFPNN